MEEGGEVLDLPAARAQLELAAAVRAVTEGIGDPPDRPFVGHLTLARLRDRAACGVTGTAVDLGFDVAGFTPAMILTARYLADALFPIVVLIVMSLLTKPTDPARVDRFYVRLKTPVGPTLVVGCAIGKVSMEAVSRAILVFYIPMLIVLALVTYVPALSLWLPSIVLD